MRGTRRSVLNALPYCGVSGQPSQRAHHAVAVRGALDVVARAVDSVVNGEASRVV